jgi:site-specific DNA-methyltransferase (adenine-specific)
MDLFGSTEPANDQGFDSSLGQWMTPSWAAQAIVEHALPSLEDGAVVLEPSCGIGRFLDVLPEEYRNIGIEVDPRLAAIARDAGHEVVTGDFRTAALPVDRAHAVIGNPPFEFDVFDGFLDRSHSLLDDGGQVIMLLPAYFFQTAANVVRWNARWSLSQEMMPRNVFKGLSKPLMLARFTRDPAPRLSGLILYHEAASVADMPRIYRTALEEGRSGWAAVVGTAIENLGGRAELAQIYHEIEPRRPTSTRFWREKVRQTLSRRFQRTDDGAWRKAA